jgi:predicted hotdog family 3-hydroxylacyl-ACP dehydratase
MITHPPPEELLPHREAALLVRQITARAPGSARIVARVPGDHALVRNGGVPACIGIELGAQAAACAGLLELQEAGKPPPARGYLAAIKQAVWTRATLPLDCDLDVRVDFVEGSERIATWSFEVHCDGARAVSGVLTLVGG